jgi:ribonuclease HI
VKHIAYTDGACSAAVGGWAFSLDGEEDSGWMFGTTNNQMELYAIYQVVEAVAPKAVVDLYTDSKLAIGWLCHGWARNSPAIDAIVRAIWQGCMSKHVEINYHKVKAHHTDIYNNRVDGLARGQAKLGYQIVATQMY